MNPDSLLAGPRGRRLLLEWATENVSDRDLKSKVFSAVSEESYLVGLNDGMGRYVILEDGTTAPAGKDTEYAPEVEPGTAARLFDQAEFDPPDGTNLLHALSRAVDFARYWQPPDDEDTLAATPGMRCTLRRVAELVAASEHAAWWTSPIAPDQRLIREIETDPQFAVEKPPPRSEPETASALGAWRRGVINAESDPEYRTHDVSGAWWSSPTQVAWTQRPGLLLAEDEDGTGADVLPVHVPADARIYEIDSAAAWAALCRDASLEVTWQKRSDWRNTTGRRGRWVMPDWAALADRYDGVHLTVAAYLESAGVAIELGDGTASVIGGWPPDATYWLHPVIEPDSEPERWAYDDESDTWRHVEDDAGNTGG